VRREGNIGKLAQLAVGREGFLFEHIETSGGHVAGFQAGDEGGLLDDATARAIEEPHALLALRERRFVDHVLGLLGQRHVNRDVIGFGQQFIERDSLDLHGLGPGRRKVRIVGHDIHAEGLGALGDLGADAAETHDAERLLEQLDPGEALAVPLAFTHGGGGLRHGTGAAQDVGESQFSRRDGIA
jgi:hypothetical protein